MFASTNNIRPATDQVTMDIADYAADFTINSQEAYQTARLCLMDTLGCGLLALRYPECTKHLGPVVAGTIVPNGAKVPGTQYQLDPIMAAFNIGCMNRWLDYNDTWLAEEWGHPSDNLGGILAVADYLSRTQIAACKAPLTMQTVLASMIKAHEIQGILALENSFNRVGLDHVILVKVASTAVVSAMLGLTKEEMIDAISNAWLDGQALRAYRHAPNTGSRKSWAAGDATSRAVRLALMVKKGEMGYPSALTAKTWGFYDVQFNGNQFKFQRPYDTYVMENVLFKLSFPAEFHAQTAVECALQLHDQTKHRLGEIAKIVLTTHQSAIRIIDKKGPLHNPADRDHCLQYMTAIGLIYGDLTADHYEDAIACNPLIDELRDKMVTIEDERFSKAYHDPEQRSIANAIQVFFQDGSASEKVTVEYPIGHRRRRSEGIPALEQKFAANLATRFPSKQANAIYALCQDQSKLEATPVHEFLDLFVI